MSRTAARAGTVLTVTLSLLQPGSAVAQTVPVRPGIAPPAAVEPETLWRVQDCIADPTLEGCPPPAAPAEGTVMPEGVVPGETTDPAAGTNPAAVTEAAPATEPVATDPATGAPAPATETAPAEAIPPEPVPQEPALAEEPAPTGVAPAEPAPVVEPQPVEPTAAEPAAMEPAPVAEPALAAPTLAEPAPLEPAPLEPAPVESAPVEPAPAEPAETGAPVPDVAPAPADPAQPAIAPAVEPAPEPSAPPPGEPAPPDGGPAADGTSGGGDGPTVTATEPVPEPVPEPTPAEAAVIEQMMADPAVAAAVDTLARAAAPVAEAAPDAAPAPPQAAAAAVAAAGADTSGAPAAPEAAATVTRTLDGDLARQAGQDFASAVTTAVPVAAPAASGGDGLSDLEKAGLLALGAVAVGMLVGQNRVVANSGDRVVVDRGNGDLGVWKDDNANLRAPGVVETIERFADGSTLSTLERADGSRIVTVRDATGRVLRRDRVNPDGSRVTLIDDTRAVPPVVVSSLPPPRARELRLAEGADPALFRALLDGAEQPWIGRSFSLEQVREVAELRRLAPEISGRPITFASGSAALRAEDAGGLVELAAVMNDLIARNPGEVFLIEGHTDAVGSAAFNLALSDRRAETVALALTEYFGVPAENLVVQGYGERFLKVPVANAEPANRRVAARRITWLLEG